MATADQINEAVGQALRAARGDLSLRQAAARSGYSASTLSRYENGNRTPNIKDLATLADAYNTTPAALMALAAINKEKA